MIQAMFFCCSWTTRFCMLHAVFSCCFQITMLFVLHVFDDNHLFSFFIHLAETNHKEWFLWNSFINLKTSFLIIMYDFHVCCSYFSYLIRSSNHMNFMFHFMSSIKSTKYESCSFLIIMNCDDSTCLLIESFFKNYNRLTWNVE